MIFEPAIAALALTSALTIVKSGIFSVAIVISVGKAPLPSLVSGTESSNNLEPLMSAAEATIASVICTSPNVPAAEPPKTLLAVVRSCILS